MKIAVASVALLGALVNSENVRSRNLSTSPELPGVHWLVCGDADRSYAAGCKDPNGYFHPTYPGMDEDKHEVRCCADSQVSGSRNVGSNCPGVYGLSEIDGTCYHESTYDEADALCKSVGARLCTQAEIGNRCTEGTGCNHDSDWVWTSTPVLLDTTIEPTDGYHYVGCGNPARHTSTDCMVGGKFDVTHRKPDEERHEVRCCSADKLDWFDKAGARKQAGCAVYGISNLPVVPGATGTFMCFDQRTQWEAEAICSLNGLRLCSDVELAQGCTRGSGCGFDANYVWSDAVACADGACDTELHESELEGCYSYDLIFKIGGPYSIDMCYEQCKSAGYAYAGLKQGDQCMCGDVKNDAKEVDSSNCDRPCHLGPGGMCGGGGAISLYRTGVTPSGVDNNESLYAGCFKDPEGTLDFKFGGDAESIFSCVEGCSNDPDGYAMAGLTQGGKCYCGKERLSGKSTDCTQPCTTGKGICGGDRGFSVYKTTNDVKALQTLLECKGAKTNWWGDPHMITFDGLKYNCQGIGHFVITSCEDYELQAIFREATGSGGKASITHGIAAKFQGGPTVQVNIGDFEHSTTTYVDECPVHLWVGGNLKEQEIEDPYAYDENISIRRVANGFEISFKGGPALKVKVRHGRGCLVDVDTCIHETCMDSAMGLLGSPDGNMDNEWMFKNGTVYFPRPNNFKGAGGFDYCTGEWCVQLEDDSLFTYETDIDPNGDMDFEHYDECAKEYPGEIEGELTPEQEERCKDHTDPESCEDEAKVGGDSAVDDAEDNDIDLGDDDDDDDEPDDSSPPDCPLDVKLLGQIGQGFANWPVEVVSTSDDGSSAVIKITSPMPNLQVGEYFYWQYPEHSGATDDCEGIEAVDKDFSKEVEIQCLHSSPYALVHLYVVDGLAYTETDTAVIDECCHPPEGADGKPGVKYTFQIACIPQCPEQVEQL